tara:strand:+ start:561 stop:818 length:258 start_codon:yes stop_codon:yes gene_type:complete
MPKKNNKKRTDEEREKQRCGGCDTYETEDGCECRVVSCSHCGYRDNLYNMNHDEFHTDYWFDGMEFDTKMSEIKCDKCNDSSADY